MILAMAILSMISVVVINIAMIAVFIVILGLCIRLHGRAEAAHLCSSELLYQGLDTWLTGLGGPGPKRAKPKLEFCTASPSRSTTRNRRFGSWTSN